MRKIDTRDFQRATQTTSREINRQIVLNLVREHQPISRADVARQMGVSRGMVTLLVKELLAEGVVEEGGMGESERGRKPKLLYVRTRDRLVVGIDVRFSRTSVMLADLSGTQIALESFATIPEPAALVEELGMRVERLLAAHGAVGGCEGIGLVVPGMVDRETGRVWNAPQLGWKDVEVRGALAARTGLPVQIENAPVACALAQMWLGPRGVAAGDFVYLTVSDGVGAGVVVHGEVVRGSTQTAGEFGHIPVRPDGRRCLCGSRGCLEAYTSNLATLSRYLGRDLSAKELRRQLVRGGLSMEELIARARSGEEKAAAALLETGRYLGLGVAMLVNSLNPARIFVGGEITGAWDLVEPLIRAEVRARALRPAAGETPVIPEPPGSRPRLRGAAALVAAPLFAAPKVA